MKTGLTLESAVRETYMAVAGGLQRVSSSQGEPDIAYCLLCDAPVSGVDIPALLRSLRDC